MSALSPEQVTLLLQAWSQGEESALQKLIPRYCQVEKIHPVCADLLNLTIPAKSLTTNGHIDL